MTSSTAAPSPATGHLPLRHVLRHAGASFLVLDALARLPVAMLPLSVLLLDPDFPRSVNYALAQAEMCLEQVDGMTGPSGRRRL